MKITKKTIFKSAENYYKEALKLNPIHFETNYYLAGLFAQTNFSSAKSLFEKQFKLNDFVEAHYNLGIILQELGDYQKVKSYEKAIKINPII